MFSSTLKVIGCLFVLCLAVHAQNPQKTRPASISGKVTLKGNGAAGIIVGARESQSGRPSATVVATTDQEGNYRISNVAPGQYDVLLAAPQYVLGGSGQMKRLIIAEGENLENVDFTILRAGVITGKVTDADGRPVIEVPVEVFGPEGSNTGPVPRMGMMMSVSTDDRGIYRVYGLKPGKYRVAAGVQEEKMYYYGRFQSTVYSQTFYPSTNESVKATLVEVTEGGETTNVDITVRRIQQVFTVTARVVDAETGQPIPDATYGLQRFRENGSMSTNSLPSNKLGEIKLEYVTPGKYALFLDPSPLREIYAEPVRFEVVDQDVKDLVIKASSGSSVSGVIVFEGVDEKVARTKLVGLGIAVHSMSRNADSMDGGGGGSPNGSVSPDGSFRLGGLRPGTLFFSIWGQRGGLPNELEVARVERDGVVQSNIEIKAGEQIKGLRLIVRSRSGRIRGVLKFENGEVPISRVRVSAKKDDANFETSLDLDDRGRFMSEALAAGLYELRVVAYLSRGRPAQTRQQVVVTDNQVTEVTMTLDLKADAGQGRP